jgi:hypothetical protein
MLACSLLLHVRCRRLIGLPLLYADGRLFFDNLSIEAKPAAGVMPTQDERPSARWKPPRERTGMQLALKGDQLLMPGLAPITDRDRLERMAKAPMRPRR